MATKVKRTSKGLFIPSKGIAMKSRNHTKEELDLVQANYNNPEFTIKAGIRKGGIAIPLGDNKYYPIGNKHSEGKTEGIYVDNKVTIQNKEPYDRQGVDNLRVLSNENDFIHGNPGKKFMNGGSFDEAFALQQIDNVLQGRKKSLNAKYGNIPTEYDRINNLNKEEMKRYKSSLRGDRQLARFGVLDNVKGLGTALYVHGRKAVNNARRKYTEVRDKINDNELVRTAAGIASAPFRMIDEAEDKLQAGIRTVKQAKRNPDGTFTIPSYRFNDNIQAVRKERANSNNVGGTPFDAGYKLTEDILGPNLAAVAAVARKGKSKSTKPTTGTLKFKGTKPYQTPATDIDMRIKDGENYRWLKKNNPEVRTASEESAWRDRLNTEVINKRNEAFTGLTDMLLDRFKQRANKPIEFTKEDTGSYLTEAKNAQAAENARIKTVGDAQRRKFARDTKKALEKEQKANEASAQIAREWNIDYRRKHMPERKRIDDINRENISTIKSVVRAVNEEMINRAKHGKVKADMPSKKQIKKAIKTGDNVYAGFTTNDYAFNNKYSLKDFTGREYQNRLSGSYADIMDELSKLNVYDVNGEFYSKGLKHKKVETGRVVEHNPKLLYENMRKGAKAKGTNNNTQSTGNTGAVTEEPVNTDIKWSKVGKNLLKGLGWTLGTGAVAGGIGYAINEKNRTSKKSKNQFIEKYGGRTKALYGLNTNDYIGAGINTLGTIGSALINNSMLNRLKAPSEPVMQHYRKFAYRPSIAGNLALIDETLANTRNSLSRNSSSSANYRNNLASSELNGALSKIKENNTADNIFRESLAKQAELNSRIDSNNVEALRKHSDAVNAFRNGVTEKRSENFVNAINNLASIGSGLIDTSNKNKQFDTNLMLSRLRDNNIKPEDYRYYEDKLQDIINNRTKRVPYIHYDSRKIRPNFMSSIVSPNVRLPKLNINI